MPGVMNGKKFVIYGEDQYRSSRYKEELRNRFAAKERSDLNYQEIEGSTIELIDLVNAVSARPLLAETRFIVVLNLLTSARGKEFEEKLLELLLELPKETVLAFVEEGLPSPSKLFKTLQAEKSSRRFNLLNNQELTKWITGYVKDAGGQIGAGEAAYLSDLFSNDLWAVSNELDKLLAYDKKIERETIEVLVAKPLTPSIFGLLDAAMRERKAEAYKLLDDLLKAGEAEMAVLGMLGKQVRDLALVGSFPEGSREDEIAKITRIHPYGVKKARGLLSSIDPHRIAQMYEVLERADRRIRSGEMPAPHALNFLISEL